MILKHQMLWSDSMLTVLTVEDSLLMTINSVSSWALTVTGDITHKNTWRNGGGNRPAFCDVHRPAMCVSGDGGAWTESHLYTEEAPAPLAGHLQLGIREKPFLI